MVNVPLKYLTNCKRLFILYCKYRRMNLFLSHCSLLKFMKDQTYEKRMYEKNILFDEYACHFFQKIWTGMILFFPKFTQSQHFLASAFDLGLKKLFFSSLLFNFSNLWKTKIRQEQNFPKSSQHNHRNKKLLIAIFSFLYVNEEVSTILPDNRFWFHSQ